MERLIPKGLDPGDLQAYAAWLISWLEYCLPTGRQARLDMLWKIGRKVHP